MKRFFEESMKKYRETISPILKKEGYKCLFKPSCSQYSLTCLKQYNWPKAFGLIMIRLLSCNPINAYLKNSRKEFTYGKRI